MTSTCPLCQGRSVDALPCSTCTRHLTRDLREVPWLHLETRHAALGLARLSSPVGGRSATNGLPVNLAASGVAQRVLEGVGVRNGIVGWVRITVEDLGAPWPAGSVAAMCTHLADHMPALRKHEAIVELAADVRDWTDAMVRVINRPTMRRIAVGPCPLAHDDAPCAGTVWATFPEEASPFAACDTCSDPDADPAVAFWPAVQWTTMGRLIQRRKAEVEQQRRLAAQVLGRSA